MLLCHHLRTRGCQGCSDATERLPEFWNILMRGGAAKRSNVLLMGRKLGSQVPSVPVVSIFLLWKLSPRNLTSSGCLHPDLG